MSLLTTYSAKNRVIDTAKAVRYATTLVNGTWSYTGGASVVTYNTATSYTRTATKSYRYVGMTKSAATDCATAMREKFQRSFKFSKWNGTPEFVAAAGGSLPMADVAMNHVAGDMWEVVISVNETDMRLRITPVANVESLFADENARDYDE